MATKRSASRAPAKARKRAEPRKAEPLAGAREAAGRAERRASFWKRNGLGIALLLIFVVSFVGQGIAGHAHENEVRAEHGEPPQSLPQYVLSGEFASSTFENWESEFLQMAMMVLLTVGLHQRGSAESRPLSREEEEAVEEVERRFYTDPPPRASQAGGIIRKLYENSLAIALFLLFAISFVAHWAGSWRAHVDEAQQHGDTPHTLAEHLGDSQFWFESFQNWQSEFLAVFALVVLSIWLRQKDSPQSKPVDAPHSATGR